MNATQISAAQAFFEEQYAKAKEVPYNPEWNAGRDYFNGAVHGQHAPLLHPGDIVRAIDNRQRKIVIVGTLLGNVAVFQRYGKRTDMYCCNTSDTMSSFTEYRLTSELEPCHLSYIFGAPDILENLGKRTVNYSDTNMFSQHIEMYEQEKEYI